MQKCSDRSEYTSLLDFNQGTLTRLLTDKNPSNYNSILAKGIMKQLICNMLKGSHHVLDSSNLVIDCVKQLAR